MTTPITLVTGGTKGIGLETVKRFVAKGHRVVTCARNQKKWTEVLNADSALASVNFVKADLSDRGDVESLFDLIKSEYGTLSIAVNNASPKLESGGAFKEIEFDQLFSTLVNDLWSPAMCLKSELNLMSEGSCIVNVSSVNGLRPTPNAAMYSSAKHGLEGLTRSVAIEALRQGIRVNAVAPGVTWTPRWEEREKESPSIRKEVSDIVPIKRFGTPIEIVNAIEWLCSPSSSYVVGHTLVVDGGLSLG